MNTHTDHACCVSASHRRALRLRLASALVAVVLVLAGAAGIDTATPGADESVFGSTQAQ